MVRGNDPNHTGYPYQPANSFNQVIPMVDMAEYQYASRKMIDARIEIQKSTIKMEQQKDLADYKNSLAEQRDVKKANLLAENLEKRELTTRAIAVDADGKFVIESTLPTGEKKFSKPVCRETGFRACWLQVADVTQLERLLQIDCLSLNGPLSVVVNQPSTQTIIKSLEDAGVYFRFSRRLKKEMEAAVVAWLIQSASIVEIPKRIGWNQMSDGEWYFEQDVKKTWEGLYHDEKI